MIIHINKVRFEKILAQGVPLVTTAIGMDVAVSGDMNTFHLLDADVAICDDCGTEQRSAEVQTPVELEIWKIHNQGQ